jgi:hypothetical protein
MKKPTGSEIKFAYTMSFITTFFVSLVIVSVNLGFTNRFFLVWMRSWLIAFVMVVFAILFIAPLVRQMLSNEK